jgi:IS30 family transposase
MERGQRLSTEQRRELWQRGKRGETMVEIGRALQLTTGPLWETVRAHGGIAPPVRKRRANSLRPEEREEISRGLRAGLSMRCIAVKLKRSPSRISREVVRNLGSVHYRACLAEARAQRVARRPKRCLLARNKSLRKVVAEKLEKKWSPQQIAGWLKAEHGSDKAMRVSHETIYKSLFVQARGVLKRELLGVLRSRRIMRRAKSSKTRGMQRSLIPDAVFDQRASS